ncbi:MAG: hypothetical protein OYH77_01965 [Pseudomonadota bacterium]|nr:hypothetical protein [Pseudomonadota bacterium]
MPELAYEPAHTMQSQQQKKKPSNRDILREIEEILNRSEKYIKEKKPPLEIDDLIKRAEDLLKELDTRKKKK